MGRRIIFAVMLVLAFGQVNGGETPYAKPPMAPMRVDATGFDAGQADIKAVCASAGRELWKFFPDYKIDPIVVLRGKNGPISLYQRNAKGEIVVRLDTGETYWCQYAYQFAHEFCHILCSFDEDWKGNMWFEETLCEMASLYVMRAMSKAWQTDPPYPNWRNYHKSIASYIQDVIDKREKLIRDGLQAYYLKHKETLEKEPCKRDLNGTMAVVLLELFEAEPEHWEAVRWLNSSPSRAGETFQAYMEKWHGAVPDRHKDFVARIAGLFGLKIASANRVQEHTK